MPLSPFHLQLTSCALAILGISLLEAIAHYSMPISIDNSSDLNPELLGKKIQVHGIISWKDAGKNTFELGIQNQGEIIGIKFNPTPMENLISMNDSVSATGIWQMHNGKFRLIIESIRVNPE